MKIPIPQNLNPNMFSRIYKDRCLYFVSKITSLQYANDKQPKDPVIISSLILKTDLFGTNYKKVINELLIKGIIERQFVRYYTTYDPKDKLNKSAVYAYRLAEKYRYQYSKWISISDLKLKKKLQVYRQTLSARAEMFIPSIMRLDFDFDGAIQYVNDTYPVNSQQHRKRIDLIEAFRNDRLYCLTDSNKPQRLYTTFSIMPKDIRTFFNDLTQLDISSSQLFHLIPDLVEYRNNTNTTYSKQDKFGNEIDGTDIDLFISLVTSGDFFSYCMQGIKWQGNKREFKDKFFAEYWYCDLKKYDTELSEFLSCNFPSVTDCINQFKASLNFPYTDKKEHYKNFPIMLQARERENVIDEICTGLIKKNPQAIIMPNQDAIYTNSSYASEVYSTMAEHYATKFKYKPHIKYE